MTDIKQREFDVLDRSANCNCPVKNDIDINRRRDGRLKQRQSGAHPIHGRDDVRARLPEDNNQNGGLASRQSDIADVGD